MPRVVFFGSPDFAVPSLKALHGSSYRPELVVTQPDRPAGRGRKSLPTAVRETFPEELLGALFPLRLGLSATIAPPFFRSPDFPEVVFCLAIVFTS